jgi:DNA-binding Xre family transcriptional regulator
MTKSPKQPTEKQLQDLCDNFPVPEAWNERVKANNEKIETLEGQFKIQLCVAIFKYRREQKFTNQEFADKLGTDPSVMSKIHNFKIEHISTSTILGIVSLVQEKMGGLQSLVERVKHVA